MPVLKPQQRVRVAIALLAVICASGCGGGGSSSADSPPAGPSCSVPAQPAGQTVDLTQLVPANYAGDTTPQITMAAPDATWTWNDPSVLKVGSEYWMYASSTVNFAFPVRLYRLTSTDGATWTRNPSGPILALGGTAAWDAGGTETPAVVSFGGQYHLFWTGYAHPVGDPLYSVFDFRIGHATSCDGVNWTKDASFIAAVGPTGLPTDAPNLDFNQWLVGEPGPAVFNGKLYLYFTAVGADAALSSSLQTIGVTTSTDGVTWSAGQLAIRPDQTLYPHSDPDDWAGYSTPNAIVLNNQMHLFFDVAHQTGSGPWLQERLHHAWSADGQTAWTHDATPIRSMGTPWWTAAEIRSPAVFLDGTTLRLYYAGNESTSYPYGLDIGMATVDLAP